MTRIAAATLAFLFAVAPLGSAAAQDREPDRGPRGGESRQADERPRVSMGQAVQRASAGRPGRFLGASNRGDTIVVRWEYPGGRVADIMVDARTGRVVGER
ncbi:MAG: PepSY domain-containing protein [Brevundimonas sp.]